MSANFTDQVAHPDDNTITYHFDCSIPIPTYLLAISVGNIASKVIGKRTSIISEPDVLDKNSKELEDLESYLTEAEHYIGPYIWGTYNIIVQPPSFPIGGMENPLLTFASPTIIVGDKS